MMTPHAIGAIVVTFHPTAENLRHLARIRSQVDLLVVVDNGSAEGELMAIRRTSRDLNFELIENGDNLGIAAALNLGVTQVQKHACRWIALFDQDSELTDGFITTMIAEFQTYALEKRIVQIIPRYRDPDTGKERPVSRFEDGGVFLAITSGSLFSVDAFEKCGPFQENLFIYCVDDDYSLRIRKKGFFIGVSSSAVLLHHSGHPTSRKLFGKTVTTCNYRPEVRYYYARNKIWILRRYARTFPRLIVPTLRELVTIPLRIALMEDASRLKLGLFSRGLLDGFIGRMGRLTTAR